MLKDDLYIIQSIQDQENGTYIVEVSLNPHHPIFEGHFPGQPILPGVCLLEMVKEILGEIKKKNYKLSSASNIKYLRLVDPGSDSNLKLQVNMNEEEGFLKVNVNSVLQDGSSNFKLKAQYVPY